MVLNTLLVTFQNCVASPWTLNLKTLNFLKNFSILFLILKKPCSVLANHWGSHNSPMSHSIVLYAYRILDYNWCISVYINLLSIALFLIFIAASSKKYDFFSNHQTLPWSDIQVAEYFEHDEEHYLAFWSSQYVKSNCSDILILKRSWITMEFDSYQFIKASAVNQIKYFQTPWNESYILILNKDLTCAETNGNVSWKPRTYLSKKGFEQTFTCSKSTIAT